MKCSELILYTDVDGTALRNKDSGGIISDANAKAIQDFIKRGGMFGVASGRNHVSIDKLFDGIDINLPYVEANGAAIWDRELGKYLSIVYISKEFKEKIYHYTKLNKNLMLTAMSDISQKVKFDDERDEVSFDYQSSLMSYEEFMETDLLKCAILAKREDIDHTLEELKNSEILAGNNCSRSADIYLEFFDEKVSKGTGIKEVLRHRNDLKERKLVCIGDYYNDISMLDIADIAICPANAVKSVQEICEYIAVSNDEDTIADALKYCFEL